MNTTAIKNKLKQVPFAPFEIVVSSGDRYRVDHPDNVLLTKEAAVVGYGKPQKPGTLPDDFIILSYLHIASIEPTTPKTARH